jgi:hypothetical protein
MLNSTRSLDDVRERIDSLDLSMIEMKLLQSSPELAESLNASVDQYRDFLYLTAKYPDVPIVPTKQSDVVWHQHILDTQKYAHDCQIIFGSMLHHYPYFGMTSEQDYRDLLTATDESGRLYTREFPDRTNPYGNSVGADCYQVPHCTGNNGSHCRGV